MYLSSLDLIVVMFVVCCLLVFSDTQTGGPTEGRERRRAATGEGGGGGERHAGQSLQTHCSECIINIIINIHTCSILYMYIHFKSVAVDVYTCCFALLFV